MASIALIMAAFGLLILGALSLSISKESENNPRNSFSRIRTSETKKSDQSWKAAHQQAAPLMKAFGWIDISIAGVMFVLALTIRVLPVVTVLTLIIASYSVAILGICWAGMQAHKKAKEINSLDDTGAHLNV